MVAKIINGKNITGALNYNEKKVAQGKAELIGENGFLADIKTLTHYEKLSRLKLLAAMNERITTNTVHISLNFAVGESLSSEKLNNIANDYMRQIGFGEQPYLVYLHRDAGHPHIHIVSTNVKKCGDYIRLHNLGKTKSEEARKSLEKKYQLTQAEKSQLNTRQDLQLLSKVEYGKVDSKRAITNVVNHVLSSYKYTSLPEFNAVLNRFNVIADRGSKESRMYAKSGLLYWCLDSKGNKVGVPIKASSIYSNPGLKKLEEKFKTNETLRLPFKERLRNSLSNMILTQATEAGFKQVLASKGIDVIYRKNDDGRLYGVTFVDHQTRTVFNGSDLGKAYSAAALNEFFAKPANDQPIYKPSTLNTGPNTSYLQAPTSDGSSKSILDDLLKPEYQDGLSIPEMSQNKRRKKKRRLTR